MHPTARLTAAHRPLIRFLGKRSWPSSTRSSGLTMAHQTNGSVAPDVQHAHPAAPEELKKSFADFLKKFHSSARTNGSGPSSDARIYQEYWEAPSKYWNSRVKTISEEEIDAVLVSVPPPTTPPSRSQVLSRAEERRCTRLHIQFTQTKI